MKKSEFKKLIKPIVHECIQESLMEDGLISGIIAEVVKGMAPQTLVETNPTPTPPADPVSQRMRANAFGAASSSKLQEQKKKLMNAIGADAYNGVDLFEGTTPAPSELSAAQQASPLAHQSPGDAGVDISNLFGAVKQNWGAHMTQLKEEGK